MAANAIGAMTSLTDGVTSSSETVPFRSSPWHQQAVEKVNRYIQESRGALWRLRKLAVDAGNDKLVKEIEALVGSCPLKHIPGV